MIRIVRSCSKGPGGGVTPMSANVTGSRGSLNGPLAWTLKKNSIDTLQVNVGSSIQQQLTDF